MKTLYCYPNQGTDFTPLRKKEGKKKLTFVPFFLSKQILKRLKELGMEDNHDGIINILKKFWEEKYSTKTDYPEFQYFILFTGSLNNFNKDKVMWQYYANLANEFLEYFNINWKLQLDEVTKLDNNYNIIK